MRERGKTTRKNVMLVLVALLLVGSLIGGTLAWLTASDTKSNKFQVAVGDVKHPNKPEGGTPGAADTDESVGGYIYEPNFEALGTDPVKLSLGKTISKDPYIGIGPGSEPSYVFAWWEDNTEYLATKEGTSQKGAFDIEPNTAEYGNGKWVAVVGTEAKDGKSALYVWVEANSTATPLALTPSANGSAWTACLFAGGEIKVKGEDIYQLVDNNNNNTVNVHCFIHQAYDGSNADLYSTALEAAKAAYGTNNSPSN